jgi:IS605 OrfB family transposase
MYKAVKVRIYPNQEQAHKLIQNMGCARFWWNYALNYCNETYKVTGKGLTQIALDKLLPPLKKVEDTKWLADRNDFLHKLSRKIVNDNQVVVVENLKIKGMVCASRKLRERNHKLAKAISDVGWGTFVNFLDYKLKLKGGLLVEIDRWFPRSKTCSNCFYQIGELLLNIREWTCPSCGTHHDRDGNAATNIRAEGIRQLSVLGTSTAASGGDVRPKSGRKSVLRQSPIEATQGSSKPHLQGSKVG